MRDKQNVDGSDYNSAKNFMNINCVEYYITFNAC